VIIGTSGSPDYLQDTGTTRFWPVTVGADDDEGSCDGLHSEGAPVQYLCSRCFPVRGDLSKLADDEYVDDQRADEEEFA
jgi:hypothetical protein